MESEATLSGVVPWEKLKCPEPTIMSIQRLKDLLYSTCDLLYSRERIWHLWRPLILFTLIKALGTYDTSSRPWTLINCCCAYPSHLNNLNALDTHLQSNLHLHSGPHLNSYLSCLALRTAVFTTTHVLNTLRTNWHVISLIWRSHVNTYVHSNSRLHSDWSPSQLFTLIVHASDLSMQISYYVLCVWQTYLFLHVPRKPCHLNSLTPWSTMHMHLNRHLHSDHDLHSDL